MRNVLLMLALGLLLLQPDAARAADPPDSLALMLPAIPRTLRRPPQRAAWLLAHFWDAMDFSDPARARDRDFLERNLVDYLSLFPHADPASRAPAAADLLQRAEADPVSWRLLAELLEKYLFEPESPVFSEETYLLFLEQIADSALLGGGERRRRGFQREMLRKNRPGTEAADFPYTARDGRSLSLHGSGNGGPMLLILYDAGCAHCLEVMAELGEDVQLAQAVGAGRLEVLAVCLDADRETLLGSSAGLPAGWMTGFETGTIYEDGLYMLRSLPALLLLDGGKRVLLRHPTPAELREYIASELR